MTVSLAARLRYFAMAALVVGLLLTAALWLVFARWGWPRGAADAGEKNDNAIFVATSFLTVYVAVVALWWSHRREHAGKTDGDEERKRKESPELSTLEVKIGEDGHFVGGDESATALIVEMLDIAAASRSVRVQAEPLEDESYRLEHPHEYVLLREQVRAYEVSLGRLMRGTVHYYWQWEVGDLVEAALELRRIELPAQRDRQWWYCWNPEEPDAAVRVGLDAKYVESIRTGYYGPVVGGQPDVDTGLPPDEPIWLVSLFPSVVWRRVVPGVVADRRKRYPNPPDPAVLDITGWVISDRKPNQLARQRPTVESEGYRPAAWRW